MELNIKNNHYQIRNITTNDLPELVNFTDKWIGTNYYSLSYLAKVLKQSTIGALNASFIALDDNQIIGVRLTLAPNNWINEYSNKTTPHKWTTDQQSVAYFKSLFIAEDHQAQGLGKKLSNASIETLIKMKTQAIVCHSWAESPNNSSSRYLQKMGFTSVIEHPNFWYEIDYECTRCAPNRCVCTAYEMIKYLY